MREEEEISEERRTKEKRREEGKEVGGIQREAAVYLKQVAAMLRATPLIN